MSQRKQKVVLKRKKTSDGRTVFIIEIADDLPDDLMAMFVENVLALPHAREVLRDAEYEASGRGEKLALALKKKLYS